MFITTTYILRINPLKIAKKFDPYCNKGGSCRVLVLHQQCFYRKLNLRSTFYAFVQVNQQLHDLAEKKAKTFIWWNGFTN